MALNTKPYRGARDFYPGDKRLQKYIFNKWREVVEKYGYEEYDAPLIEPIEIFLAKTGDEIVNDQTYDFIDRGKRRVVIRPEMTPSVSRLVAAKRQELAYPLRWYSIPNLWRYERPQKGRLREHWQLNVDIFGIKNIQAEIELISLVVDIFKSFNAKPSMYEIRLNHRGLTDFIFKNYLKIHGDKLHQLTKLIDRMHKMPIHDFISIVDQILPDKDKGNGLTEKLISILKTKSLRELPKVLHSKEPYLELSQIFKAIKDQGISNATFDPSLMRGFDYYSGPVFEVYDKTPDNNRSMMGGGRYDGLVGLFGVPPIPTVGFGWGDVTLIEFLKDHHLLEKLTPETDAYVALVGDVAQEANKVVADLRQNGLNLAVDYSRRKLGAQLKTAEKKSLSRVIIMGKDELSSGMFKLKDLTSSNEESVNLKDLVKLLKK